MGWQGARMPIPGNAEWLLWFLVEIVFAIIWAASDTVDASLFVIVSAVITFGYLISRGIAKASRVLEQ
jgi:nicotinamide riboside transporter PnuC